MSTSDHLLLKVSNLKIVFQIGETQKTIIDDVDYKLNRGQILGIVGESGSGKTQSSFALLGIESSKPGIVEGDIDFYFGDHNSISFGELIKDEIIIRSIKNKKYYHKNEWSWNSSTNKLFKDIRGRRIFLMFQDPKSYLNPFWSIRKLFSIVIPRAVYQDQEFELLFRDSLSKFGLYDYENIGRKYPHQLSGGQIQRVMIALGYACKPDIIIADEITTGLDVVNQRSVVENLKKLLNNSNRENSKLPGIILISHDMGFISKLADYILVMYAGQGLEYGEATDILNPKFYPKHPYTSELLNIHLGTHKKGYIDGDPPNLSAPPNGCRFHERCIIFNKNKSELQCDKYLPKDFDDITDYSHQIRCRKYE